MISTEQKSMIKTKSDPVRLATYLLYGKEYNPENEQYRCMGTGNGRTEDAGNTLLDTAIEMENLCSFQPTKKNDLIRHITISLPAGEHLTLAQWENTIKEHLKHLGCEEYVSGWAVHKDTDNEHAHIMICRVHPKTHRLYTFPYSHKKLQQADYVCEQRFGLQIDNHPLISMDQNTHDRKTRTKAETEAKDLEAKTMQQSFFSYLNEHLPDIEKATNWQDFHRILASLGVEVEKRGRGLILKSLNPEWTENSKFDKYVAIKGSSLGERGHSCSLHDLEARFGSYEPKDNSIAVEKVQSYKAKPLNFNESEQHQIKKDELKRSFEEYREQKAAYEKLNAEYRFAKSKIYEDFRKFQRKLKLEQTNYENYLRENLSGKELKQQLYQSRQNFSDRRKKERQKLENSLEELKRLYKNAPKIPANYQEYLTSVSPEEEVLQRNILMSRRNSMRQTATNFAESTTRATVVARKVIVGLKYVKYIKRTHKGQEIYQNRLNKDLLRDDGRRILTTRFPSVETVRDLLIIASQRYGNGKPVKISGTPDFQRMCAVIAAKLKIGIECTDIHIQNFYQYRSKLNERREQPKYRKQSRFRSAEADRSGRVRRFTRSGIERELRREESEFYDAKFNQPKHFTRAESVFTAETIFTAGRSYSARKSNTSKTAERTFNKNATSAESDMREMPTGSMDAEKTTDSVHVSDHAHDNLGQSASRRVSDRMRWQVHGSRGTGREESSEKRRFGLIPEAVQKYIDERNEKRQRGIKDILPHVYWQGQTGSFRSFGIRKLGDKDTDKYVLLEQDGTIYIRKLPEFLQRNTANVAKGETVILDENGYFKFDDKQSSQQYSAKR